MRIFAATKKNYMKQMFDWKKFAKALNDEKLMREYNGRTRIGVRKIGKESGVSFATASRIFNGNKADIDSVLLLCKWMKSNINSYIK